MQCEKMKIGFLLNNEDDYNEQKISLSESESPALWNNENKKKKKKRRENVAIVSCPAGLRKVYSKTPVTEPVLVKILAFTFFATDDLLKCPRGKKNREKLFRKGDTVVVLGTFKNFDDDDSKSSSLYSSMDVWVCAYRPKRTIWKRPLSDIMDKVTPAGMTYIEGEVVETGLVGEVAKRAHEDVSKLESYRVKLTGFCDDADIWIDARFFEQNILRCERSQLSPYMEVKEEEEKEEYSGPEFFKDGEEEEKEEQKELVLS